MDDEPLGDDDQFEALYRQFSRRLRLMARRRGVPAADAEDLVHETFIKAIQGFRRGDLRDPLKLAGWLHGIFNNLVAGHWRKKSDRDRLLPPADSELLATVACVSGNPKLTDLVTHALRKMSKRHRLVLLLNARDGLKAKEIAPILGRAEGTVGEILADAKQRFRLYFTQAAQESEQPKRLEEGDRRGTGD